MSTAPPAPPPSPQTRKNLTNDDRRAIFERLLELSDRGKLPRGAINNVATTWGRDRATITRIWCRGTASRLHGHAAANVASKIKGIDFDSVCGSILKVIRYQSVLILANCGRKKMRTAEDLERAIRNVPHERRMTMRGLAAATGLPKTTLQRHKQAEPRLRAKSN